MRQLHSEGQVLRELIDQFEAAEAWLTPMRPWVYSRWLLVWRSHVGGWAKMDSVGENVLLHRVFCFVLYEFNVCVVSDWSRDEDLRWSVRRDLLKDLGWGSASEWSSDLTIVSAVCDMFPVWHECRYIIIWRTHSQLPMSTTMDMLITCCHLSPEPKYALQTIQLVEATPPPRFPASPSSSCASDDDDNDDDDDDEEEESCESYCSSEEADDCDPRTYSADTYASRMKRILAWRDNFSVQMMSTALSGAQVWHCFPRSLMWLMCRTYSTQAKAVIWWWWWWWWRWCRELYLALELDISLICMVCSLSHQNAHGLLRCRVSRPLASIHVLRVMPLLIQNRVWGAMRLMQLPMRPVLLLLNMRLSERTQWARFVVGRHSFSLWHKSCYSSTLHHTHTHTLFHACIAYSHHSHVLCCISHDVPFHTWFRLFSCRHRLVDRYHVTLAYHTLYFTWFYPSLP